METEERRIKGYKWARQSRGLGMSASGIESAARSLGESPFADGAIQYLQERAKVIDWSLAPGATHYAPAESEEYCAVFWRMEGNVGVEAWQVGSNNGSLKHFSRPTWREQTLLRLIARPTVAVDGGAQ